ncbi:aa3-type cytochrome c oxidase subunit IV [Fuscibacter oryzae]|uniref:Aa3-type cytochrome c oxidase subunit IV n=1 Tax=Fuscibacter oryzae TaxID=2803939 RepID=A0A8J7MTU0_9RHOB|nr:aa3-type cytochrome c oxidase subunit IV [Fuscibacter oryzae]MBL4928283.1 aa3-type cytochrome c oxidase subunit IV [Fuscibacter oryzae]
MAEHKPGTMDIRTQEKTFAGFIKFTTYTTVVILLVLIFLALSGT